MRAARHSSRGLARGFVTISGIEIEVIFEWAYHGPDGVDIDGIRTKYANLYVDPRYVSTDDWRRLQDVAEESWSYGD